MSLERLTEKALAVLQRASTHKSLTAKEFVKIISEEEGLGRHLIGVVPPITIKKTLKLNLDRLIKEAFFQAIRLEHTYVGTEHLYLALLKLADKQNDFKLLDKAKVEIARLGVFPNKMEKTQDKVIITPLLDAFGEDINNKELRNLTTTVVQRPEYEKLVSALMLKDKANVLLVGDPGVGKKSLVRLLAQNINNLDVPPILVGYNLRSLNLLSFMTSVANKGGIEFGIAALIEELKSLRRVIVVLNNFQDIFFSSPVGLSIPIFYSILKSYFEEANIPVITYLTPQIYEKLSNENEHIIDIFTVIEVSEPSLIDTKEILKINAKQLEKYHNVKITDKIIDYVLDVSTRKIKNAKFPLKAIDLLDYASASAISMKSKIPKVYKNMVDKSFDLASELDKNIDEGKYDNAIKIREKIEKLESNLDLRERKIFTNEHAITLVEKDIDQVLSNFDIEGTEILKTKDITKFTKIASELKKRVIGQDAAVDVVSKALIRARLGLRSRKRPLGNFLFLGPTGVGKTELAKVLGAQVFSGESWKGLIRLDMSDFSEKHTVARLVGAPPGYVGYGEGGELTSKIEAHPESVVLFDEIEKAHPDVLNILLQIMEEGELADARGNTFDFSNSVIILTSNLGTDILHAKGIGYEEKDITDEKVELRLKENLKKIMKAELLNRFDEIVVFKRLTRSDSMKIINILLKDVSDALKIQDVKMRILLSAKRYLLDKGFSKEFGARALRRIIEKDLLDKVAQMLIDNEARPLSLKVIEKDNELKVQVDTKTTI